MAWNDKRKALKFPVKLFLVAKEDDQPQASAPDGAPQHAAVAGAVEPKLPPQGPIDQSSPLFFDRIGRTAEKRFDMGCAKEKSHHNLHEIGEQRIDAEHGKDAETESIPAHVDEIVEQAKKEAGQAAGGHRIGGGHIGFVEAEFNCAGPHADLVQEPASQKENKAEFEALQENSPSVSISDCFTEQNADEGHGAI